MAGEVWARFGSSEFRPIDVEAMIREALGDPEIGGYLASSPVYVEIPVAVLKVLWASRRTSEYFATLLYRSRSLHEQLEPLWPEAFAIAQSDPDQRAPLPVEVTTLPRRSYLDQQPWPLSVQGPQTLVGQWLKAAVCCHLAARDEVRQRMAARGFRWRPGDLAFLRRAALTAVRGYLTDGPTRCEMYVFARAVRSHFAAGPDTTRSAGGPKTPPAIEIEAVVRCAFDETDTAVLDFKPGALLINYLIVVGFVWDSLDAPVAALDGLIRLAENEAISTGWTPAK